MLFVIYSLQQGTNFVYPDRWDAFRDAIPESERGDLMAAYYKRLTSDSPLVRREAANAWATWEINASSLIPPVSEYSVGYHWLDENPSS